MDGSSDSENASVIGAGTVGNRVSRTLGGKYNSLRALGRTLFFEGNFPKGKLLVTEGKRLDFPFPGERGPVLLTFIHEKKMELP